MKNLYLILALTVSVTTAFAQSNVGDTIKSKETTEVKNTDKREDVQNIPVCNAVNETEDRNNNANKSYGKKDKRKKRRNYEEADIQDACIMEGELIRAIGH